MLTKENAFKFPQVVRWNCSKIDCWYREDYQTCSCQLCQSGDPHRTSQSHHDFSIIYAIPMGSWVQNLVLRCCFLRAWTFGMFIILDDAVSGKGRGRRLCTGDIWSIFPQLRMVWGLWGAPVLPRICVWTGSFNSQVHTLACACALPHKHTRTHR